MQSAAVHQQLESVKLYRVNDMNSQSVSDDVCQRPKAKPSHNQWYGRRGNRLPNCGDRVTLQHPQEENIHRVPERPPQDLIGDDLGDSNPPGVKEKREQAT